MKKNYTLFLLAILCLSCQEKIKEISWNPYYPNTGITKEDLIKEGFEVVMAEHGACLYRKREANKQLVFGSDINCEIIYSQQLYIYLGDSIEFKILDSDIYESRMLTFQDSIRIVESLKDYKSKKISNFTKVASCNTTFKAENEQRKIIEWDLDLCSRNNDEMLSHYIQWEKSKR